MDTYAKRQEGQFCCDHIYRPDIDKSANRHVMAIVLVILVIIGQNSYS